MLKFVHKSPRSMAEKLFQPRVTPLSASELGGIEGWGGGGIGCEGVYCRRCWWKGWKEETQTKTMG